MGGVQEPSRSGSVLPVHLQREPIQIGEGLSQRREQKHFHNRHERAPRSHGVMPSGIFTLLWQIQAWFFSLASWPFFLKVPRPRDSFPFLLMSSFYSGRKQRWLAPSQITKRLQITPGKEELLKLLRQNRTESTEPISFLMPRVCTDILSAK